MRQPLGEACGPAFVFSTMGGLGSKMPRRSRGPSRWPWIVATVVTALLGGVIAAAVVLAKGDPSPSAPPSAPPSALPKGSLSMFARKSRVGLSRRLDESNAGKPTSSEDSCETNGPKLWAAIGTGYPSLSPREEDENAKRYAIGNPYGRDFFRLCSSESYRCSATEWDNFNIKHTRLNRRIYDSAYAARLLAGKTISTLGELATAIFGAWIGGAVPGAPNIMKGCTGPSEYVENGVYKCGIAMMELSFYKEGNEDDPYTYQSCVFNIFDEVSRFIKSGSRFGTLTLGCTDLWYCNATVEFVLENSEWSNESSTWTLASTSGVAYHDGGEGGWYSGYEWEVVRPPCTGDTPRRLGRDVARALDKPPSRAGELQSAPRLEFS